MYSGKYSYCSAINVMNDSWAQLLERYVFPEKMQRINYVFLSLLEDKQQSKFGVVITGHLTLFLACFSVYFSRK